MSQNQSVLKIYHLSHPLHQTEWLSVLGDKYSHALHFKWEEVEEIENSHIVVWDGVITQKNKYYIDSILPQLKTKTVLLMGEARTLLKDEPSVKIYSNTEASVVELPGWSVLPEDILAVLEACYKKMTHV